MTDDDYAETFVQTCVVVPVSGGLSIEGECPRCHGHFAYPHAQVVFKTVAPPAAAQRRHDAGDDDRVVRMMCTCPEEHSGGSPDDGCGAYWNLHLTEAP
jgi:hypothetical protein